MLTEKVNGCIIDSRRSKYRVFQNKPIGQEVRVKRRHFVIWVVVSLVAFVFLVWQRAERNDEWSPAVKTEVSPIQAAIVAMTNTYEEIGWRDVLGGARDPESQCSYVIVSMNNMTNETKTFVKCWVDGNSFPGMARYTNGVMQVYVLKVQNMFSAFPSLIVKLDARTTRADK